MVWGVETRAGCLFVWFKYRLGYRLSPINSTRESFEGYYAVSHYELDQHDRRSNSALNMIKSECVTFDIYFVAKIGSPSCGFTQLKGFL